MEKRLINLDHSGKFYLYAEGKGTGYGFPVRVNAIPSVVDMALDTNLYKFKQTLEKITIQISKSG